VKSLGLDDLAPFKPEEKIIEYMIEGGESGRLVGMSLVDFAQETSSESMAPGGGSISAYAAALGVSLGTMVANLSAHKRGWDARWEEFSEWAVRGMEIQEKLIQLVDEDTNAFNKIMEAFGLPKGSDQDKAARKEAIQAATKYAIEIPLEVARTAFAGLELCKAMAEIGNPNSITDAGVGALCSRSAVLGAVMNVQINMADLEDKVWGNQVLSECKALAEKTESVESEVRKRVAEKVAE